jgi:hypothetical protein
VILSIERHITRSKRESFETIELHKSHLECECYPSEWPFPHSTTAQQNKHPHTPSRKRHVRDAGTPAPRIRANRSKSKINPMSWSIGRLSISHDSSGHLLHRCRKRLIGADLRQRRRPKQQRAAISDAAAFQNVPSPFRGIRFCPLRSTYLYFRRANIFDGRASICGRATFSYRLIGNVLFLTAINRRRRFRSMINQGMHKLKSRTNFIINPLFAPLDRIG